MTAATKEPSVKSVVYTSSSFAALTPKPNEVINVTKETWNQEVVDEANGPNPTATAIYGASKTEAERALWKAVKETNPPFQVSAVLPNANFGPIMKPGGEMESSTATMIVKLFNGDPAMFDVPPVSRQLSVA
jgi:nucleoside-diphosphate-sugar epimerase